MRVYHFTSAKHAIQNLQRRRLKIARINDLNDPFDLHAFSGRDPHFRRAFQSTIKILSKTRGILCFSKNWSNPVQWSHYADRHCGICLGFEVPNHLLIEVDYQPYRVEPNMKILSQKTPEAVEHLKRAMNTKFNHWIYEEEFRKWEDLEAEEKENGLYFASFSESLVLKQVIVGHRCEATRNQIFDALGDLIGEVEAFKARLAFKSFSVTRQKAERFWH